MYVFIHVSAYFLFICTYVCECIWKRVRVVYAHVRIAVPRARMCRGACVSAGHLVTGNV
jgi:hypothetical protein